MAQLFHARSNHTPRIPGDILAFRSITRLISAIQQGPFSDLSDRKITQEEHHRDLTLSVAFSILAALEREVVAVVAKQTINGLEVIVCSSLSNGKGQSSLQQFSDKIAGFGDKVMDFAGSVLTMNARYRGGQTNQSGASKNQANSSEYPSVASTCPPCSLGEGSDAGNLQGYIYQLCEDNLPSNEQPHIRFPLHQHLEVLRQLLSGDSASGSQIVEDMLHYIVATSYRKINNRVQKRSSMDYLNALTSVSASDLGSVAQPIGQSNAQKNKNFLLYLAALPEGWKGRFPKLYKLGTDAEQAQKTVAEWHKVIELYSDDTREEFHKLFIMCLWGFAGGIEKLDKIRHPPKGSKESKGATDSIGKSFQNCATSVAQYGDCLQKLTRTHALQLHLHAVLSICPDPSLGSTATPTPEMDDDQAALGEEDEIEPLLTDTDVLIPHVKPYHDWLRHLIAEFDAADILIRRFVLNEQSAQISVKVVNPSAVADGAALTWESLFLSPSYIYDTKVGGIDNMKLLQFLTNIESALPGAEGWLKRFNQSWQSRDEAKMQDIIQEQDTQVLMIKYQEEMRKLKEWEERRWWRSWLQKPDQQLLLLPDWAPMLNELTKAFSDWKLNGWVDIEDKIQGCLESLGKSIKNYGLIAATNCADGFEGGIHCEACLASLIAAAVTASGDMPARDRELFAAVKDLTGIIGVSKCCCPACARLLKHLKPAKGEFHTRGSHNTISSCSLPLWLPQGIVAHMNNDLGAMLREELVKLIKAPELHRKRANSTSSSGTSSIDEHEVPTPFSRWSREKPRM